MFPWQLGVFLKFFFLIWNIAVSHEKNVQTSCDSVMLLVSSCVPVITWLCSRVMRSQSRPINWPLLTIESPVVQWLEHPTRSRRVVGSNPIWGSDFFRVLQTFNLPCVCCFIFNKLLAIILNLGVSYGVSMPLLSNFYCHCRLFETHQTSAKVHTPNESTCFKYLHKQARIFS